MRRLIATIWDAVTSGLIAIAVVVSAIIILGGAIEFAQWLGFYDFLGVCPVDSERGF